MFFILVFFVWFKIFTICYSAFCIDRLYCIDYKREKYCIVFEYILITLLLYTYHVFNIFCVIISLTFYGILINVVLAGITTLLVNYVVL